MEPAKPDDEQKASRDAAWAKLREEQIVFIAQNTTPAQRVEALEQMIEMLKDYLPSRAGIDPRYKG